VFCPHCNVENKPGAKFCRACGAAISQPSTPVPESNPIAKCSQCSRPSRSSDRFCSACGSNVVVRKVADNTNCAKCKALVSIFVGFCYACGANVQEQLKANNELFVEDEPDLLPKYEA
jgi:predicted amidophosphoribosyltransferase